MADVTIYPPVGFHFNVEFTFRDASDGDPSAEVNFMEVSGLGKEVTTEEFIEGGENRYVHRFPKGTKYNNLILRRGMMPDSRVTDWVTNAIDNFDFHPADVTVKLLNPNRDPLVVWSFQNCWPVKWSTSDLKAMENSLVIESLELNYTTYKQKKA